MTATCDHPDCTAAPYRNLRYCRTHSHALDRANDRASQSRKSGDRVALWHVLCGISAGDATRLLISRDPMRWIEDAQRGNPHEMAISFAAMGPRSALDAVLIYLEWRLAARISLGSGLRPYWWPLPWEEIEDEAAGVVADTGLDVCHPQRIREMEIDLRDDADQRLSRLLEQLAAAGH